MIFSLSPNLSTLSYLMAASTKLTRSRPLRTFKVRHIMRAARTVPIDSIGCDFGVALFLSMAALYPLECTNCLQSNTRKVKTTTVNSLLEKRLICYKICDDILRKLTIEKKLFIEGIVLFLRVLGFSHSLSIWSAKFRKTNL
ncbi:hypothetical protein BpHYR1_034731 [Brachionus plicatilis]|uniref:Uncharacterized protein n=1 Tax=Brachionus plicatilis TaxID=10195 RepID=A0A3M7Q3U5_BRAPC|nr:hypothetical protein BpHYR1_034731 [Brachionus plicatilis]